MVLLSISNAIVVFGVSVFVRKHSRILSLYSSSEGVPGPLKLLDFSSRDEQIASEACVRNTGFARDLFSFQSIRQRAAVKRFRHTSDNALNRSFLPSRLSRPTKRIA